MFLSEGIKRVVGNLLLKLRQTNLRVLHEGETYQAENFVPTLEMPHTKKNTS